MTLPLLWRAGPSRGAAGERAPACPARGRVDDVRTGTTLDDGSGPLTTDGVWVVVDLAVSGTTGEASVEVVALRDAVGRGRAASARGGAPAGRAALAARGAADADDASGAAAEPQPRRRGVGLLAHAPTAVCAEAVMARLTDWLVSS